MGSTDSLADLARPALAEVGLQLWDVEVTATLVRFLVDRDGGVDLDAVASAGTALAPVLADHEQLLPAGPYDLEVSSPGIERVLRTAEHFRRSAGALVNVKTRVAVNGARRFRATVGSCQGDAVELVVEGAAEPTRVALDDIDKARIVFEWGPSSTPSKAKKPTGKKRPHAGAERLAANEKGSAS